MKSSAKAILVRLVEERHHSVELLPGIRDLEFIAVLVGELFILLRIVKPVFEVEHDIGVAVGLITVQAALVVVGNGIEIVLLITLWFVFFRQFVEVDENARGDEIGNAEACRQRDIEGTTLGDRLKQNLLIDLIEWHFYELDVDTSGGLPLICNWLDITQRSRRLQNRERRRLSAREFLRALCSLHMNILKRKLGGEGRPRAHEQRWSDRKRGGAERCLFEKATAAMAI